MSNLLTSSSILSKYRERQQKKAADGIPPPSIQPVAFKLCTGIATYPFEFVKVLLQLGYEPIQPVPGKYFGQQVYYLPNVFTYLKYIKSVDGFGGCFRGCGYKVGGNLLQMVTVNKLLAMNPIKLVGEDEDFPGAGQQLNSNQLANIIQQLTIAHSPTEFYFKELSYRILVGWIGCLVSQPFCVIGVRCVGEFVGREEVYSSLLSSLQEIATREGLLSLFTTGLVPRLVGDTVHILIVSCVTYFLNEIVNKELSKKNKRSRSQREIEDEEEFLIIPRKLIGFVADLLASSVTYQFQVLSTLQIINTSNLLVSKPPFNPNHAQQLQLSTFQLWRELKTRSKILQRGNSLFIRFWNQRDGQNSKQYFGPKHEIGLGELEKAVRQSQSQQYKLGWMTSTSSSPSAPPPPLNK